MNKEECMLALEQMILELPQYRKITNELCNRFIPMYVRNNYEQEQIYIEGDHSSSKNYCRDIYDTIPISIIESILDNFKEQDDIKEENTNLKQALYEIKEYIKGAYEMATYTKSVSLDKENIEDILQIIDKYMKEDD